MDPIAPPTATGEVLRIHDKEDLPRATMKRKPPARLSITHILILDRL